MAGIFNSNGIWTCGFDFFGTGTSTIVSGGVFDNVGNPGNTDCDPAFARFAGKGIRLFGVADLQRSLNVNLQTVIAGFAFSVTSLPVSGAVGMFSFRDATAGTDQVGLCYTNTGALQCYKTNVLNGGAPSNPVGPASVGSIVIPNSYMYVEIEAVISSSVGQISVFVNGNPVLSFTGNTQSSANAWCNQVQWGAGSGAPNGGTNFDDLYLLDLTAPSPLNTFLGPVRIQTDGPNADSATSGLNAWAFTTPQGTDFGNLANIPPNTAQYDSDGNLGDRMSFRFPSLTSLVYALNMWYSAEIDAAGSRSLVPIYRNNGIDQAGPSPGNLNSTYTYYNQACTLDPNTGLPFPSGPQGAVNTVELGLKVNS